jgi:excisionase family DNA binding protein|tara:strand:+ start:438 stop:623 length:186 start_codon:yes stop_codon:yes gene_type:complete
MKYKNFYTLRETAGLLQVSENTIYRMAKRGDIEGTKVGWQWRFSEESIKNIKKNTRKKHQH